MTLPLLVDLRDALTAAINIHSQNDFLLDELMRAKDGNARLITALSNADMELRKVRKALADQELEIRRLKVAVEANKPRPKAKRRHKPLAKRKQKAL
jgi:hypothetical protein